MSMTGVPGFAAAAPIAAGMPKPIEPRPPEVTHCRGRSMGYHCAANIWCCPTPVVMMARPPFSSLRICKGPEGRSGKRARVG